MTNAPTPYADARNWDDFTPRVALEYRGSFGLAYLSYSRGFKSGGYNYPASLNPVLNPETLDSYELGIKADLADGRLRLRSALFHYDFKDLQVSRGGAGAFITTENAASATVRGLEVDVGARVTPDLSLEARHRAHRQRVHRLRGRRARAVDGSAVRQRAAAGRARRARPVAAALAGRSRLRRHPLRAAARRRRPHSRSASTTRTRATTTSISPPVAETEWLKQDAYGVLNARVAYASADSGWEIGVWGTNLTDASYYEDAVLTSASSRVSYADPRTYGVDFKLRL